IDPPRLVSGKHDAMPDEPGGRCDQGNGRGDAQQRHEAPPGRRSRSGSHTLRRVGEPREVSVQIGELMEIAATVVAIGSMRVDIGAGGFIQQIVQPVIEMAANVIAARSVHNSPRRSGGIRSTRARRARWTCVRTAATDSSITPAISAYSICSIV